jgi:UDP-N-acetylmuramate--alanine ligase
MENLKLKDLKNKTVHFVGIGGISMSALALMLKKEGATIQGSDLAHNSETQKLEKCGVKIFYRHSKLNLKGVDFVVYSSAIHDDNEELDFARKHKIPIIKRAELLGLIASGYKTVIAVAGSHGKTTTTAMLAEIFLRAGMKPTFHVGGTLSMINSNYKLGNKKIFITEACEYMDNFLYIKPDIAVILNVDSDHLDYFKTIDGVKKSFKKFVDGVRTGGIKVISNDDENSACLKSGDNVATFGTRGADIYASNIKEYEPCKYSFDVIFSGYKLGNVKLNMIGKHNILNALASIIVALSCAIDFSDIKFALENFSGVKRRSELISNQNQIQIYHDYAHHPNQIQKMVSAAHDLTKKTGGKIIAVFEPHTYSRTKFLLEDFAKSFALCDYVIFAPVYSAREDESQGVQSDVLAERTKCYVENVEYILTFDEIEKRVKQVSKPNDVVLILGAGTIEKLAERFKIIEK